MRRLLVLAVTVAAATRPAVEPDGEPVLVVEEDTAVADAA
jgi:hypothetical protein